MKIVQQFAVQFDPPTLFVEYKQGSSIYVRRIRIKQPNIWIDEGPESLARRIILKFPDLFKSDYICYEQLCEVLKIFQRSTKKHTTFTKKNFSTSQSLGDINNIDLNKCSDEINQRAKKIMDIDFEAKRLKPGDPKFEWDKSTNFNPPTETTDWDLDDD